MTRYAIPLLLVLGAACGGEAVSGDPDAGGDPVPYCAPDPDLREGAPGDPPTCPDGWEVVCPDETRTEAVCAKFSFDKRTWRGRGHPLECPPEYQHLPDCREPQPIAGACHAPGFLPTLIYAVCVPAVDD